jgi:hypothetical protein
MRGTLLRRLTLDIIALHVLSGGNGVIDRDG